MNRSLIRSSDFSRRRASGFSLVELMVALLIGLIISLGAAQLFITSKRTYDQMSDLAQRQENLRALVDFVSLDVRTASRVVTASGSQLTLDYLADPSSPSSSVRPGPDDPDDPIEPYCPSDDDLEVVEYTHDEDANELRVRVVCTDDSSADAAPLISGVDAIEFFRGDEGSGETLYVGVEVSLSPIPGESAQKSQYQFIVDRRSGFR